MTHYIEILPATTQHVQELGVIMNAEDWLEAEQLGMTPHRALWRSWKMSTLRNAAIVDGEVAAIWGVVGTFMGLTGRIWMVTGPKAREVSSLDFALLYRREVRKMLEIYPRLENIVDNNYSMSLRMLAISGFSLGDPVPVGPRQKLYRLFYKEA